jgi:multidrug resistance efflux pump
MQVLQSVAKPGSIVRKGDFIAEFDRQYQLLRLDDFRSDVDQQERDLVRTDSELMVTRNAHALSIEQAQSAVEKAKLDIKTIPVRSDIEAEILKLQLEEAQARLKQLQAEVPFVDTSEKSQRRIAQIGVDQSKVELKRAEMNVDRMVVKSPMDGMLVMMTTFRGSEMGQIQQGDQLFPGMMFAQVVDPSSMLVSASINQSDVELLRIGAKAHLRFDAYPGLEAPAHVVSIGAITRPGGMRANFVKEVPVFLRIDKMDPRIIPDLSVSVDVVVDSTPEGVVAPLESLFYDSPDSKPSVYLKSAKGFERREVEIGLRNNISAIIKSGLRAGDIVAAEPPRSLAPPTSAQSGAKPGA